MSPDQFKAWRAAMGLSQADAATALGISRASVQLYERGERHEDGRTVEVPHLVELACERVSHRLAAEQRDTDLLFGAMRVEAPIVADLIPSRPRPRARRLI